MQYRYNAVSNNDSQWALRSMLSDTGLYWDAAAAHFLHILPRHKWNKPLFVNCSIKATVRMASGPHREPAIGALTCGLLGFEFHFSKPKDSASTMG